VSGRRLDGARQAAEVPALPVPERETRLLIWDFDGTLAYRRGRAPWSLLLAEVLDAEEPGHAHSFETFRPYLRDGFPWDRPDVPHLELCGDADGWWDGVSPLLARAYEAAGYSPERAVELAAAPRLLYVDPAGWSLFDDTLPTLERLAADGWQHAILSNHVPELGVIAAGLGLDRFVVALSCSADTGYEKPHPLAYASVLEPLEPAEAWMIGDNVVADVLGAEAVGIPAILVRRPDPRAARYADTLADVEEFLAEAVAA
jgi:putative hydrolase of the HAD superfamily